MQISTPIFTPATAVAIMGIKIRQDAEGRYCLNDCHKASGGISKDAPAQWLRTDSAKRLVTELETMQNCTVPETTGKPVVTEPGRNGGTYVAKELVYAYAMWISPAFNLTVIRAFDALMSRFSQEAGAIMQQALAITMPKANALDRIAGMDGYLTLTSAAKELDWPPRKFIAWLHENKWIYRQGGSGKWIGYSERTRPGYLSFKHYDQRDSDGRLHPRDQVVITKKGMARLAEILPLYEEAA